MNLSSMPLNQPPFHTPFINLIHSGLSCTATRIYTLQNWECPFTGDIWFGKRVATCVKIYYVFYIFSTEILTGCYWFMDSTFHIFINKIQCRCLGSTLQALSLMLLPNYFLLIEQSPKSVLVKTGFKYILWFLRRNKITMRNTVISRLSIAFLRSPDFIFGDIFRFFFIS